MPSQVSKDIPILMTLFGDEELVTKYKELDDPGHKIAMIWKTAYFQVKLIQSRIAQFSIFVIELFER